MTARVIQADVFDALPTLAAGSVDCCVTSIPYWQLRDYSVCPCVVDRRKRPGCTDCDDNGKVPVVRDHQLGLEPTVEGYVARMVEVFRLVRRALADHGTCWLNVGDTFACSPAGKCENPMATSTVGRGRQGRPDPNAAHANEVARERDKTKSGIPQGNLCLVPQRLALALQADGWVVRSVIVWHKPAPMPASLSGWRWVRCRVKVKAQGEGRGKQGEIYGNLNQRWHQDTGHAEWADCPG